MKAIINRTMTFGTLDGVITKNDQIRRVVNRHLKYGCAKLLVDTEETLMYELKERPLHIILGYSSFCDYINDARNHM
jgi:hypothetical protein